VLTPEERRGALLILALVLIGGVWDVTRARKPAPPPPLDAGVAPVGAAAPPAPAAPGDSAAPAAPTSAPAPVDVNHAGAAELDALPGIGPVLARRILEHRERHGAFRSLEELRAVRGIGPSLLAKLSGRVRFGP